MTLFTEEEADAARRQAESPADADTALVYAVADAVGQFTRSAADAALILENALADAKQTHVAADADADRDYRLTIAEAEMEREIAARRAEVERRSALNINDPEITALPPITLGSQSWAAWFYSGQFIGDIGYGIWDAGVGAIDVLSCGATLRLRDYFGWSWGANPSSWAYFGGAVAGVALQIVIGAFSGGTCAVGGLATFAKIYTAMDIGAGLFETYEHWQEGPLGWRDALNVLPAVAWGVGRAGRALSKWACFEAGTPIVRDVLPAEATTLVHASVEPRAFDRASLALTAMLVGALASAQAVYECGRRRLTGPEPVRDLFFCTLKGRIDDEAVDALAEGRHRKPGGTATIDHVFSQAWA